MYFFLWFLQLIAVGSWDKFSYPCEAESQEQLDVWRDFNVVATTEVSQLQKLLHKRLYEACY